MSSRKEFDTSQILQSQRTSCTSQLFLPYCNVNWFVEDALTEVSSCFAFQSSAMNSVAFTHDARLFLIYSVGMSDFPPQTQVFPASRLFENASNRSCVFTFCQCTQMRPWGRGVQFMGVNCCSRLNYCLLSIWSGACANLFA